MHILSNDCIGLSTRRGKCSSNKRETMNVAVRCLVLCALCASTLAWDPFNMAATPPMGFANWNGFGCDYNDTTFRNMADFMNASGLAAAGYRTMIIQECITKAGHRVD